MPAPRIGACLNTSDWTSTWEAFEAVRAASLERERIDGLYSLFCFFFDKIDGLYLSTMNTSKKIIK